MVMPISVLGSGFSSKLKPPCWCLVFLQRPLGDSHGKILHGPKADGFDIHLSPGRCVGDGKAKVLDAGDFFPIEFDDDIFRLDSGLRGRAGIGRVPLFIDSDP